MIPLFNIRGYVAPDPLDALSPRHRLLLSSGVALSVSAGLLSVVYYVLQGGARAAPEPRTLGLG